MAIEGHTVSSVQTRSRFAPWVAEAAFVALLLLVFVGLTPFPLHDPNVPAKATGAGDLMRQVCYLLVFALIFASAYDRRAFKSLAAMPLSILTWLPRGAAYRVIIRLNSAEWEKHLKLHTMRFPEELLQRAY